MDEQQPTGGSDDSKSDGGPAASPNRPIPPPPAQEIVELMGTVAKIVKTGKFKPPLLPEVAMNLGELASKPDVDLREIESAVALDPAIAARILSVARSALYSRGAQVKSLRVAIMRIGLMEVRDVAFSLVAGNQLFNVPEYSDRVRQLFEAAQASGLVAREICRVSGKEADLAYLCGLLHDLGEALLLGIIADIQKDRNKPLPSLADIQSTVNRYHSAIGAKVCELWKLPDSIRDAVLFHHYPVRSQDDSGMAAVVAVVDVALSHAGLGCDRRPIDPSATPAFAQAGMSVEQAESLLEYVEMLVETPEVWAM